MQTVPIIREPTPRKVSSPTRPRSKSPTQKRYSHLLYLSEAERQLYVSKMEKSSASSLRSSNSVRSNRTASSSTGSQTSVSTGIQSKLSMRVPRFVDHHYPLIATIHLQNVPTSVPKDHPAFWCARQMAQIHNTIIRALNASWNQAVLVQPDTQEAADFLLFNQMLFNTLNHHHHVEDDYMFPAFEKLMNQPGALEENTKGHESFAEGLTIFQKYVFITKPAEYNGATLRHIIESFAPNLIQHLHDEIPTLANLHHLDGKELMKIWKHAEHIATKDNSLYTDAPWTLGCQDKSFTIDGEKCGFPNVPWVIEAVIRNWHAKKHAGAWKFCPSDLSGRRRVLPVA